MHRVLILQHAELQAESMCLQNKANFSRLFDQHFTFLERFRQLPKASSFCKGMQQTLSDITCYLLAATKQNAAAGTAHKKAPATVEHNSLAEPM